MSVMPKSKILPAIGGVAETAASILKRNLAKTFWSGTVGAALAITAAAAPVDEGPVLFGVNSHFGWDEGVVDSSMSLFQQAGLNGIREGLNRIFWEPDTTGKPIDDKVSFPSVRQHGGDKLPFKRCALAALDAAPKYGLCVFWPLNGTTWNDYGMFPDNPERRQSFARFCAEVVKRTRGKARYYQVWNEWDGGHEMYGKNAGKANTPENYVELLKVVTPAIRKANPDAIVVANSFCMGNKPLFAAFKAGMLDYCDAYAIHPYALKNSPEEVCLRLHGVAKESAKYNHGKAKPFFISEMGWLNTYNGITDAQSGDYIARMYLLAKTVPGFRGMTWYNFNERTYVHHADMASLWGVVMPDLTPKDAYYAMTSVGPVVKEGRFLREVPLPKGIRARMLLFQQKDGRYVLAAWSTDFDTRVQFNLYKKGGWQKELQFVRCGSPALKRRWGFRDQAFDRQFCGVKEDLNKFSFHATSRPVLLYNVPADFIVSKTIEHVRHFVSENMPITLPSYGGTISRTPRTLDLTKGKYWRTFYGKWNGPEDFGAKLTVSYDDQAIHVKMAVTDDVITYGRDHTYFWKQGECAFLGLSVIRNGKPTKNYRQYTVYAWPEKESRSYCWDSHKKKIPTRAKCAITYQDDHHYTYEFTVPFTELAAECGKDVNVKLFESGKAVLGFAIHASDNDDGSVLKGGFHWGNGVTEGPRTSPSMYGWLFFE